MAIDQWSGLFKAQRYEEYVQKHPSFYRTLATKLCEHAQLQRGMSVIDLACGTGVVTEIVLGKLMGTGTCYGVDFSADMLSIAQQKFPSNPFIQSSVENLGQLFPPASIDVVLCNSAFWLFKIEEAFTAINVVLKADGRFVFNLPALPHKDAFWAHLRQIAREEYSYEVPLFTTRRLFSASLIQKLEQVEQKIPGFTIQTVEKFDIIDTSESRRDFFRIPAISENYLGDLDYETRVKIIEKAYQRCNKEERDASVWYFFVATKD